MTVIGYLVIIRRAARGKSSRPVFDQFDLSGGCPRCGSGATQKHSLLLRKSDLSTSEIRQTCDNDYVVTSAFRHRLIVAGAKKEMFQRIAYSRNKQMAGILDSHYQLASNVIFPGPGIDSMGILVQKSLGLVVQKTGTDAQCSVCMRDGHYGVPHVSMELVYQKSNRLDVSVGKINKVGFAMTWELFGFSVIHPKSPPELPYTQLCGIARPILIVSPFLAHQFLALNYVELEPIRSISKFEDVE